MPIDKTGAIPGNVRMPALRNLLEQFGVADKIPGNTPWPVPSYVRQTRIDNRDRLLAGKTVYVNTPHGRIYVNATEHEVVT